MDLEKFPKELIGKREIIECNFVLSLYQDITLVDEYKNVVNGEDILTDDGQFYYGLIQKMRQAGYSVADVMSIYEYLEDKKDIKNGFERRGGYDSIKEITDLLNLGNLDVYYDELAKNNLLLRLHSRGFNVIQNIDKFKDMSAEEVYDYMEFQLADTSIGKIEKAQIKNLSDGYEEFIKAWDSESDVGFDIGLKMLNYRLLGVHKKNLLLHLAGIGIGKTTSAIAWYVIPAIIKGNNVCIIANEQNESEWRQMLLSTVLFNTLNKHVKGLDRHKMLTGGFTEEQKDALREAEEWLKNCAGKVAFVETQNYDTTYLKKIIARQSKVGYSLFLCDTVKPMDDASDKAWGQFSEVAKSLFLAAKKYDVAVIATMQLSAEAMSRKYLDITCIGKSKATAETASSVVMFRPITKDEKSKILAVTYDKNDKTQKEEKALEQDKDYIMIFTPKNRFGSVSPQIIAERNMNFNTYKEVGWYECTYDEPKKR